MVSYLGNQGYYNGYYDGYSDGYYDGYHNQPWLPRLRNRLLSLNSQGRFGQLQSRFSHLNSGQKCRIQGGVLKVRQFPPPRRIICNYSRGNFLIKGQNEIDCGYLCPVYH